MTYKEAIDFINNKIQIDVRFCSDDDINETKTALTIAIQALEKQIPKKPKAYIERGKYFDYECPKCGMTYGQTTWHGKFCPNCGQALDFSERSDTDEN